MRVIGIDPGLTRCGVGVVDGGIGSKPTFVAAGVVRTKRDTPLPLRLLQIEEGLTEWFDKYRPDTVAVERVFAQHNLNTVTDTAQAAGIGLLISARRKLPANLYTPSEVKAAVTGSGKADKQQIGTMVTQILALEQMPKPADAADAVALAICQLWRGGVANRYQLWRGGVANRYAAAVAASRRK
ncbi:MAG: crossover junction endodeoxyribonuclease RuvC [Propionibacterium sp.]|nr:MAG: crossover junction endodeoxyribonuclease RuvC [Propionibacterium sp.]